MQLTTLVELLEQEIPGVADASATQRKLADLYADRGLHDAADQVRTPPAALRRGTPPRTPR